MLDFVGEQASRLARLYRNAGETLEARYAPRTVLWLLANVLTMTLLTSEITGYWHANDLKEKVLAFRPMDGDFNCYRDYTPEKVMPILELIGTWVRPVWLCLPARSSYSTGSSKVMMFFSGEIKRFRTE